ncbi:arabinogalactan endo-1,4-beta-galactosidase [Novosphingobium sp. PhB165]|uniref:glycoside hydrolase family 53 protein n=1 Tax=Novosphingobium sp. PhB165 TaxID=2485105 RepID=UPI001046AA2B|nr:glycosyl hydrolase 53 family protein [Novosphingobium sp. PhB165]TCM17882.1 arabinogalactan endo-1,4-beta-galactosidase [Novosphingobium sp. PhB165]
MKSLRPVLAFAALLTAAQAHAAEAGRTLYLGADLSFANEMADCGAVFRQNGKPVDPFVLLKQKGGNIMRVRIWNNPDWTHYSNYEDVLKTIRRAHAAGLQVLLDFHYSDDWADGDKQIAPKAWAGLSTDDQVRAVHDYTRDVLAKLNAAGELPELVQVGNETNPEVMGGTKDKPIDWKRNARLINAGVAAVREASKAAGKPIKVMLHIAQPENVLPWFDDATAAGVLDYDIIGISYYSKWSKYNFAGLSKVITAAHQRYGADVMVVETAYPFTEESADASPNLLGTDSLVPGYPATPQGQLKYLEDLTQTVVDAGGNGVVYWAPDWVSTQCKTRWGTGSNWENAAWFDLKRHEVLPVMDFLSKTYTKSAK